MDPECGLPHSGMAEMRQRLDTLSVHLGTVNKLAPKAAQEIQGKMAEATELPLGTVKSRLNRARLELATSVKPSGEASTTARVPSPLMTMSLPLVSQVRSTCSSDFMSLWRYFLTWPKLRRSTLARAGATWDWLSKRDRITSTARSCAGCARWA